MDCLLFTGLKSSLQKQNKTLLRCINIDRNITERLHERLVDAGETVFILKERAAERIIDHYFRFNLEMNNFHGNAF